MNTNKILKSPLLPIGLFGLVVYLLSSKKTINKPLTSKSQIDDLQNNDSAINTSIQKGNNKSYSSETYISIADKIYSYLNRSNVDETNLFKVLSYIKNDTDFLIVQRVFGTRELDIFWRSTWGTEMLTLKDMLSKQLDNEEKTIINKDFEVKGMTSTIYKIK